MGNAFDTTSSSPGGGDYTGRYMAEPAWTIHLDQTNLTQYLDLNNDGVRDSGTAAQCIDVAEGRVDFYTGGPFTFTANTNGTVAAKVFLRWSMILADDEAVAKRIPVTTDAGQALERRVNAAIKEMGQFRKGEMLLPGAVPANAAVEGDEPGEIKAVPANFDPPGSIRCIRANWCD